MEVPSNILQIVRTIETARQPHAVDVPFARVIRAIAKRTEHLRKQFRPLRTLAFPSTRYTGKRIATNLLGVIPGEQSGSRGPASRRVVELGKPETARGEPVQV